jgi:hypothetical protein
MGNQPVKGKENEEAVVEFGESGKAEVTPEEELAAETKNEEEEADVSVSQHKTDAISNFLNQAAAGFDSSQADKLYSDELNEMTWGRRLARYLSAKYEWYDPSAKKDTPSLDAAWAYFEHSALPRHFPKGTGWKEIDATSSHVSVIRRKNSKDLIQRAEYGEKDEKTRLYNVWSTPESEMGDFGASVGIYFWLLRVFAIITLIAGFISLPNIIYFASDEYGQNLSQIGLMGSAICTDTAWVACPTCAINDWDEFPNTYSRFATSNGLSFILRNFCNIRYREGIIAFVTLVFVFVSVVITNIVSRRREVKLDEAVQTSTDYSVEVLNPPSDAFDPEEWKDFFSQFADDVQVAAVTVAVDDEDLIRLLVKRRKLVRQIKYMIKPGIQFDTKDLETMAANCVPLETWQKYLLLQSSPDVLLQKIRKYDEAAKQLTKKSASVSHIFATFETEESQRAVLNALSRPGYQRMFGNVKIPEKFKFRGKHVLNVKEPAEPSSVRWHDLDETLLIKLMQLMVSFTIVFVAIALGAYLVYLAGQESPIWASLTVSSINQVTPRFCKWVNNSIESHRTDGSRQASLYIKMTLFKWVNTAVVTAVITAFVSTVAEGSTELIPKVLGIFVAELVTNPLILISDSWGHTQRHILGPRALDQERMNLSFRGGLFLISLRYTEITKILFLTFFYAAIFPAGFFFAAASLSVNYWVDKFCLLRTYGPAPLVGNAVAESSRSYLMYSALAVYALMVSYNFAGFPFDQACDTNETVPVEYEGNHIIATGGENHEAFNITITPGENAFKYCFQDMIRFRDPRAFPAVPSKQRPGEEWMTEGQTDATSLLGWTSVVIIAVSVTIILRRLFFNTLRTFLFKPYRPMGEASEKRFSEVKEIYGYVPQVEDYGFEYPLIACDISDINPELLSWSDPSSVFPFDEHNIMYDVPGLLDEVGDRHVFSIVKTWSYRKDLREGSTFERGSHFDRPE